MPWSLLVYFLLPYAVIKLVWRGLRYRPYFHGWSERFGFVATKRGRRVIWIHAVSVGEVRSASALIFALAKRYPHHEILVTTMTPTGGEQVRSLFGGRASHSYVPFDFPDAVARFLDRVRPEFAVIAETEFWPNLFAACRRRQIPLLLVNVRISADSLAGYLRVPKTARKMLGNADLICAQTRTDAQRLRNLGVPASAIEVTGNLKFDIPVPNRLLSEARQLRCDWGTERQVLIAGSTHAGEERKLLDAYTVLRERWPGLLLVLAPRNPERFRWVSTLCRARGFEVAVRSRARRLEPATNVLVCDTMGELQLLYAASDIAFVGASLVKLGGHNILESCAVGVPVIFGPHMFNFEDIAAMAIDCGAARQVYDTEALIEAVSLYLEQRELRSAASRAALGLVAANHGSLEQTLCLIGNALARTRLAKATAALEYLN